MADWQNIPKDFAAWKWRLPFLLGLIAAVTIAVYWPALHNGFIDYDDPDYVTVNMLVRQGLTLKGAFWSFTAFHAGNWHPLTWLSHMLDIQLFDLNPSGHHATSVLFHVANALLVCLLLFRMTGFLGRSLLVALLFALHPLHVESVAWISERKDVLSTFFWLLTMLAYLWYARNPSVKRYLAVVLLFVLGLMAKQMLVTLPVVLLLVDFWPLKRYAARRGSEQTEAKSPLPPLRKGGDAAVCVVGDGTDGKGAGAAGLKRLLVEKAPLLALSAAAAGATILAQNAGGALQRVESGSLLVNLGNGLICYLKYLGKMVWPVDLALFYPLRAAEVTPARVAGALVVLALISGVAVWQRKRRPYLLFGWSFYLVTLLPVMGFVRVGSQAMADRYTYIPLIGIFLALVWGGAELAGRWRTGLPVAAALAAVVLALFSALTVKQIGYWRSSGDLYAHALSAVKDNWLAHNNMAILQAQQYRFADAIRHFQESLRINPDQAEGYQNLGNAYQATGNYALAIDCLREAVRLKPDDPEGHFRLGYAYLVAGNGNLAYQEYLQLNRLDEVRARPLLDSIRMGARR